MVRGEQQKHDLRSENDDLGENGVEGWPDRSSGRGGGVDSGSSGVFSSNSGDGSAREGKGVGGC